MSRLAAVSKALYYPTPLSVMRLIAGAVRFTSTSDQYGEYRLLDPCAGAGDAVAVLGEAWNMPTYGVELDAGRAREASTRMTRCLHGSSHQIPKTATFSGLFLNPPYDWSVDEEDGSSTRQEVQFLVDSTPWLESRGLLVFIPPRHILRLKSFREHMEANYTEIRAWSFPVPEVEAFDQVVVIARRYKSSSGYGHKGSIGDLAADPLPVLDAGAEYAWNPQPVTRWNPSAFALDGIEPVAIAPHWTVGHESLGYASRQWDILCGDRGAHVGRPLTKPRAGHQAMLLAAGALDGAELPGRALIKGSSEKIKVEFEEDVGEGKTATVIRERIVSRLSVLDLVTGAWESWRTDQDEARTAKWFQDHGDDLAKAIQASHTPSFNGDLTPYRATLATLTAPGILPGHAAPEILPVQQEAAAATAFWWSRGNKAVLMSGEMGTGKTTVATVAVTLAQARKVIVVCPSHLVRKWIRETETITGVRGVAVSAKRVTEVDAFFEGPARFLILSKDMAKLGSRWEPRHCTKTVITTKEVHDREQAEADRRDGHWYRSPPMKTVRIKTPAATCPKCGAVQPFPPSDCDTKVARSCTAKKCGEMLWQNVAISARGTNRWPLARYIRQRYARRYHLICDEFHQFAGANSDQSRAVQDLCSGAKKVLAMTGTLYGGRASSIFHLLYKVDPGFRDTYGYSEVDRFVAHHGLFEERFEEEERTSTYGYRRGGKRSGGRIREIPGMSPAMIPTILPFSIFLKLADLRLELPPYREEVELLALPGNVHASVKKLQADVKSVLRKHPRVLGAYLQACLGYCDCPGQSEEIVDYGEDGATPVTIARADAIEVDVMPKDNRVVEIVREERAAGRRVLVFFTQTHRRDARARARAALEAAGFRVATLDSGVAAEKREEWVSKHFPRDGRGDYDVMFTNGKLVETGLDLLFAQTIIQYGIEYSIPTLRQSVRRSWRLGQRDAVRVVFLGYAGTMQEAALNLIAKKMRAAEMVDGDETGGLAKYDDSGKSFFLELAHGAAVRAGAA